MPNSPTVRRKRLSSELRRLRLEAKVSVEQVAEVLDCSVGRVGHLETGRNSIRKPELQVLLELYNAPPDVFPVLDELRKAGAQRGWWATYKLPVWLSAYVGLEAGARSIKVFEIELVTALLQTPAYARRVQEVAADVVLADSVDRLTDARMRRQTVLEGPNAIELHVILSESAIARAACEPGVGAGQLRHIAEMARRPNIKVQLLPTAAGLHPVMSGSFHILEFEPDVSLPVAYQEYAVGGHVIDEQDVVATLDSVFETLLRRSLDVDESLSVIEGQAGKVEKDHGAR